MSDRANEQTPFVTPDSLRQFLKLYKRMYDLHTDKNFGLDDTGGIQYASTIENFGSEILIEANKLRMKKPPIDSLNIADEFRFYFNLRFVDDFTDNADAFVYQLADKYSKQNMVCGLLDTEKLINGYKYELVYEDISIVYALSSDSTSDPDVKRMAYFRTTTTPKLVITDPEDVVTEIELTVSDGSEVDTSFYFPINIMTYDLLGIYPVDAYIKHIEDEGTFTIDLNSHRHDDIPYIWFCVDRFRKLPTIYLDNNRGYSNQTLLTPGMDGNSIVHLYPSADKAPCVPTRLYDELEQTWFLKAYGDYKFEDGELVSCTVKRVEYLYSDIINPETPTYTKSITYDDTYMKMKLNMSVDWTFRAPEPGEYDYDEHDPYHLTYAYVTLDVFDVNTPTNVILNNTVVLTPGFDMILDERKYIDYFEQQMNHATTGIHIDYTDDYSENGVDKLRGIIHGLGKFDGLPEYYDEWSDDTRRGHVELYSIRDSIFNNNNPMNRQTAGIIIDTGVPQNKVRDTTTGYDISIKYVNDGVFDTVHESESDSNHVTDLGYRDTNVFTYTGIPEYYFDKKFIYHGSGVFSLGFQSFDSNVELGRVYYISNDPNSYENNVTESKPPRTLARICDIPTSYLQLINITNYAPTYALDPYYTRQYASWDSDQEQLLWNTRNPRLLEYQGRRVFNDIMNLNLIIPTQYIVDNYSEMENFDRYLDMTTPSQSTEFSFSIYSPGEPNTYAVDDEINIVIGGINFRAVVMGTTTIGLDTYVSSVVVQDKSSTTLVNIGNIVSKEMVCKTTAVTGIGKGLLMLLTIDDAVWDSLHMTRGNVFDDIYALRMDSTNRVWVWKYADSTWYKSQLLIGEVTEYNFYDEEVPVIMFRPSTRKLKNVLLFNMFNSGFNTAIESDTSITTNYDLDVATYDVNSDLSQYLINHDETVYVVSTETGMEYHTTTQYQMNRSTDVSNINTDRFILPQHHDANTFFSYTPAVKLTCDSFNDMLQPDVSVYSPMKNKLYTYSHQVYDEAFMETKKAYTLKDILDPDYFAGKMLLYNVYSFSYMNDVEAYKTRRNQLVQLTRSELIDIIATDYPDAEPVIVEGSVNEYTINGLINYILEHESNTRRNTILFRNHGELYDEGKQFTGGYSKLDNMYDVSLNTDRTQITDVRPTTFLKLNDDFDLSRLNSFRMYDDMKNDVSKYCILLIQNKFYTFRENAWYVIKTTEGV